MLHINVTCYLPIEETCALMQYRTNANVHNALSYSWHRAPCSGNWGMTDVNVSEMRNEKQMQYLLLLLEEFCYGSFINLFCTGGGK